MGNPSCASSGNGDVTCATVGVASALFGITFNPTAGTTSDYQALGGTVIGNPSCASSGNGDVTCATVGVASALFGITFNPTAGTTSDYQALGGTVIGDPSCVSSGNGDVICVVVDTDFSLSWITINPTAGTTSDYQALGGTVIGNPSCASSGNGDVTCAVVSTDFALYGLALIAPPPPPPNTDPEPEGLQGITRAHNLVRQNLNNSLPPVAGAAVQPVPAPPLQDFTWDEAIAVGAQAWADRCVFEHSPSSDRPNQGENIAAGTGGFADTPEKAANLWANEVADPGYDYASHQCPTGSPAFPGCGHYTQIVWATSLSLGCGRASCPNLGDFWVCRYAPPGNLNIDTTRPYCTATQTTDCQAAP
jgi:hypothetical protein